MRWMDIPVTIRRMAKRTKEERYASTTIPNTKVGLNIAMIVVVPQRHAKCVIESKGRERQWL
jgi:hypothetical protein